MKGLALALLLLFACGGGPKAVVERVEIHPGEQGQVLVSVVISNEGGDGESTVRVTLRDRTSRAVLAREESRVQMKANERVTVEVPMKIADVRLVVAEAEILR